MAENAHNCQGCQAPQPKKHRCHDSQGQTRGHYGRLGFGQVVASVSIRSTPKGSAATLRVYQPTRGNFLGQMEKTQSRLYRRLIPSDCHRAKKTVSKNPRSTVATVTEVMDYLRVLYANIGTPHCPNCGREVFAQSAEQIAQQLAGLPIGTKLQLLAPVVRNRKGTHVEVLADARTSGFARARINGDTVSLSGDLKLEKKNKHSVEIVVDRLVIPENVQADETFLTRLTDSVETTLKTADGLLLANYNDADQLMSEHNACPHCDIFVPRTQHPDVFRLTRL